MQIIKNSKSSKTTKKINRTANKQQKTNNFFNRTRAILFIVTFSIIGVIYLALTHAASITREYPWHTNITATTFWVGENFRSADDGSQVCSAYQSNWAQLWAPKVDTVSTLKDSTDCSGSPIGGCDGVRGELKETAKRRTVACETEARHTRSDGLDYFPSWATATKMPQENPFYLDLPYNDTDEGYKNRCDSIPWANDPGFKGNCTKGNFSYMKNRWVEIKGPNNKLCYGQIQDAGPSDDESNDSLKYKDAPYVFGSNDARPSNKSWGNAGMDVSPALNGCLGFKDLDGTNDKVSWRWVEASAVPNGPWSKVVTTSQANWNGQITPTDEYIKAITPGNDAVPPKQENFPPEIKLSSPQENNSPTAPATVELNANANDNDGIESVSFYQGATLLGSDNTSPYSITVNKLSDGEYKYTAIATDKNPTMPKSTTSNSVTVKVKKPKEPVVKNDKPIVTISSPQTTQTPKAPGTIVLNAEAKDNNGIKEVQFYKDGVPIEKADSTLPYSLTIKDVPAGKSSYYAIVTDASSDSLLGTSNTIDVLVKAGTDSDAEKDVVPPTAPSNISANLYFDWGYKMSISWKPSKDNSGKVQYKVNWTDNATPMISAVPYQSFSVSSVKKYDVSVQAIDPSGNKSEVVKESFTPKCFIIWCWL